MYQRMYACKLGYGTHSSAMLHGNHYEKNNSWTMKEKALREIELVNKDKGGDKGGGEPERQRVRVSERR